MYRKIIHDLNRWKYSPHRNLLILQGAREYENAINWLKTEFKGSLTSIFSAFLASSAVLFLINRRARRDRKGFSNGFLIGTLSIS